MTSRTVLGLTVNPEFVQSEGLDAVIRNAASRMKASVVATVPAVMEPSDDSSGGREPPLDAGAGKDRVLDRALWGRNWLHVKSAPSFAPRRDLYCGLAFQPPEPDGLTDREGPKVAAFLRALKALGIETHLQIMAAAPPCYRVQSRGSIAGTEPLTVDGRTVNNRVDANLSLAHPELRAYLAALIRDLIENYPDADVLRFDWPEYPPYHPDSLLFDFNPYAVEQGEALGIDVSGLKAQLCRMAPEVRTVLAAGNLASLSVKARLDDPNTLERIAPVIAELLRYRTALAGDYVRFLRDTVHTASGGRVRCFMQCFPPPLNSLSGFSIEDTTPFVPAIGVKLYTMHWPMIERAYAERFASLSGENAAHYLPALRNLLKIGPDDGADFAAVHYPLPDETHPAVDELIEEKLRTALDAAKSSRLWGITHAYGPPDDVIRRFHAVRLAANGYVHINRYGYLSDEKINRIETFMSEA